MAAISFTAPRVQLERLPLYLVTVKFGGKIREDAGVHTWDNTVPYSLISEFKMDTEKYKRQPNGESG